MDVVFINHICIVLIPANYKYLELVKFYNLMFDFRQSLVKYLECTVRGLK